MAKIDTFFKLMLDSKASDLHIAVGNKPILRQYGRLIPVKYNVLTQDECKSLIYEILKTEQVKEFEEKKDMDFSYELVGVGRFRANICMQRLGIEGSFRRVSSDIPTFEELGLPDVVKKLIRYHQGLVLVTGPTGVGKTTTLAAMIDSINRDRKDHIITVEDPIEYIHPSKNCLVNQREVGKHTLSFQNALRAALREDPDIIFVGEMRDLETISLAITAAETGHLVFGTLHTSSAHKTVDRIIDVFPPAQQPQIRTMLSESLRGVISQVLVRRADGNGMVAVLEILVGTISLANMIRDGKTFQIPSVMQTGKNLGMQTMDDALMKKVEQGIINLVDAVQFATNKNPFISKMSPEDKKKFETEIFV
jgi:twitching motility protein PilT